METTPAKTLVTKNKSTYWFGAEYTMNIYRGCCHGCIYCDSRSECYRNNQFDTVMAKENALEIIAKELKGKREKGVIATGAMSDPYNPFEKKETLSRRALKLMDHYGFGTAIATKSDLIVRDMDILSQLSTHTPVICKITITTASDALSKKIEPSAPVTSRRFDAVRQLAQAGIFTGLLLMPVLPYITDSEENIRQIVAQAAKCGARFIYPGFGVTLRDRQRDYYFKKLDTLYPELRQKYMRQYGNAYSCDVPQAKKLYGIFKKACIEAGIVYKMGDIIKAYKGSKTPKKDQQLSFF